ncbi:MAG: replication initiator [Streptosporangiaceae bacterium]
MTAATVTLDPEPLPGPGPGATADDTAPATRTDFRRWEREFAADDGCSHPIRLHSRIDMIDLATGELAPLYGQASVACGNRREAVCPACSAVYKRDARQLVRAGLAGGKGIPDTIAAHPCVFATLTAPSFGPVHARRLRGKTVLPCRPRRDARARRCPHGRDISCPTRHAEDDPRLGQPMCPDCFDYQSAVLFNAHAADLWRRFVTYLPRHLARLAGVTQKTLRAQLRIRFVKVAEYQARGVVHFHAVIRLDAAAESCQPPAAPYTADLLCDAIGQAAAAVRITVEHHGQALALGFGPQTDTRIIRHGTELPGTGQALNGHAVANYIAKYATKTTSARGLPSTRIRREADIGQLRCPAHYRRLITAAWQLGGTRRTARFRAWAHMLGYGGHFLTKSRRYSVTFSQLRAARADHRRAARPLTPGPDAWDRPLDETVVLVLGTTWTYAAGLNPTTPIAELAAAAAARAREHQTRADHAASLTAE